LPLLETIFPGWVPEAATESGVKMPDIFEAQIGGNIEDRLVAQS